MVTDKTKEEIKEEINEEPVAEETAGDSFDKNEKEVKEEKEEIKDEGKEEPAEDENTKYLRLMADFQNYKKRVEKEKKDLYAYANENIMNELLNVLR